jgi:hypothetical protein
MTYTRIPDDQLVRPTVHMNGTSRQALHQAYFNAYEALDAAGQALMQAAPHGRDYYPQGPDAINAAGAQHRARIAAIASVRLEIEALCLGLA